MKILCVPDIHFSQYSSIIRKRGEFYSKRLENLLWSINWVEKQAIENNIDLIVYLGDFFDRSDLNAEELTAFRDIVWAENIQHYFLVGNHEVGNRVLDYSSIHFIESLGDKFKVIDNPFNESHFGCKLLFLPYIFENDRKELNEYWKTSTPSNIFETQEVKDLYIFSHNDIKGVQYGKFESKEGFDVKDIENNCKLFINGHIHNGAWVKKNKILNLGNLTGQNFNEDAFTYEHHILILDTDKDELKFVENPYAFNFYKIDLVESPLTDLDKLKTNSVITIKCYEKDSATIKEQLESNPNIAEYRLISVSEDIEEINESTTIEFNSIDHLKQFQEYIINQLGNSDKVIKELQEVLK